MTLQQQMPPAHHIAPHGLATHQVPGRFLRLVGHVDRRQLPGPQQADQFPGIAASGLDALPGAARRQGRRDHLARDPTRRDLAVEVRTPRRPLHNRPARAPRARGAETNA